MQCLTRSDSGGSVSSLGGSALSSAGTLGSAGALTSSLSCGALSGALGSAHSGGSLTSALSCGTHSSAGSGALGSVHSARSAPLSRQSSQSSLGSPPALARNAAKALNHRIMRPVRQLAAALAASLAAASAAAAAGR